MICGGIDLGGTKIEARLFSGVDAETVTTQRRKTPLESFDALLAELGGLIDWLEEEAGGPLPIGLAMPGVIAPDTGISFAANLPSSGEPMAARIAETCGREVHILNDCMAFAYSEAQGGAGAGADCMVGLILGTGVGAGVCIDGKLPPRLGDIAVEIGHQGLPASVLQRFDLPALPCGCGQVGCVETYVSGPGLVRLVEEAFGRRINPETLGAAPNGEIDELLNLWSALAAEALYTLQVTLAPDRIVLGGGLSKLPGSAERLQSAFARTGVLGVAVPEVLLARFGDTSGARGAALYAREQGDV